MQMDAARAVLPAVAPQDERTPVALWLDFDCEALFLTERQAAYQARVLQLPGHAIIFVL